MKKIFFKKHENVKHTLEKREESAHQGVSFMAWPSAIRHSKSAEQHSSNAKRHTASPSLIHAILRSWTFFKGSSNTQIFVFLVKLGHLDMPNLSVFKNHQLHHYF